MYGDDVEPVKLVNVVRTARLASAGARRGCIFPTGLGRLQVYRDGERCFLVGDLGTFLYQSHNPIKSQ